VVHKIVIIPAAQKDLDQLEKQFLKQVTDKIWALASEPRPAGCLKLTNQDGCRLRSGDYRILYRIDDSNKAVYIYRIKHRKDVYKKH